MAITNLDHVVVAVNDLEAATKTWQENFGLPLERSGANQAILPIGSAFVELIQPLGDSGPVADHLKNKGEGLYLISLAVDDMAKTLEELRAKGVRVNDPPAGGTVTFISPRAANVVLVHLGERKAQGGVR